MTPGLLGTETCARTQDLQRQSAHGPRETGMVSRSPVTPTGASSSRRDTEDNCPTAPALASGLAQTGVQDPGVVSAPTGTGCAVSEGKICYIRP